MAVSRKTGLSQQAAAVQLLCVLSTAFIDFRPPEIPVNSNLTNSFDKLEFGEEITNDSNIIHINGSVHQYHLVFGKSGMCN